MPRKYWLEVQLALLLLQMENFRAKIGGYAATLGLTPAQITYMQSVCDAFISVYEFSNQCKLTMQGITQWRDRLFYGGSGDVLPIAPPVFPVGTAPTVSIDLVGQFIEIRDMIVALPKYELAIGEDLGLVGAETGNLNPDLLTPELKVSTSDNYTINLKGSMQGMSGLRVDYKRDGEEFQTVGFFTNLPATFSVTPESKTAPEKGQIRAVYIRKNEVVGNFSPIYPVVVS